MCTYIFFLILLRSICPETFSFKRKNIDVYKKKYLQALNWFALMSCWFFVLLSFAHATPYITRFTSKKTPSGGLDVFAILLSWPDPGSFRLGAPNPSTSTTVSLLGVCKTWCVYLKLSMNKCIIMYYQLVETLDFKNLHLWKWTHFCSLKG